VTRVGSQGGEWHLIDSMWMRGPTTGQLRKEAADAHGCAAVKERL
jgi:hypothetical protein